MTQVTCPVDGCDYTGPKRSVASHYSGKKDEAHSGGYERAMSKLETSEQTQTNTDNQDGQAGSRNQDDGSNPTFGSAGNSGGSQASDGGSDTIQLPCGHESFDPSRASSDDLVNGKLPVECDTCGEVYWYE